MPQDNIPHGSHVQQTILVQVPLRIFHLPEVEMLMWQLQQLYPHKKR
jgi:hypothetical protein